MIASVDAAPQEVLKTLHSLTTTFVTEGVNSSSTITAHSLFGSFTISKKRENMKTKYLQHLAILSTSALLFPLGALARDSGHWVDISSVVQIGSTHLKPGNYKVAWQGTGPVVQVSFQQNGKTVATLPATLKTNDDQVKQDAIMTEGTSADTSTLKEIDFGHQREALVFDQNSGGM